MINKWIIKGITRNRNSRYLNTSNRCLSKSSEFKIIKDVFSMRNIRKSISNNKSIGFVATMGGLHDGHLALVKEAREKNEYVFVSIFVNPTQFGPGEDYISYPRTLDTDIELLKKENINYLFVPDYSQIYRSDHSLYVVPEGFEKTEEGKSRPLFFRGVATILTKLFNIIQPTDAYFGQKDAIQCLLVKKLVKDLDMDINVHIVDTKREINGLAMSTRNQYLTNEEKMKASVIFFGLNKIKSMYLKLKDEHGNNKSIPTHALKDVLNNIYMNESALIKIFYISFCDKNSMKELEIINFSSGALVSVAVQIGNCRLVDNIIL